MPKMIMINNEKWSMDELNISVITDYYIYICIYIYILYIYIYIMYIYMYVYIYNDSQIVHHNPCFNLLILRNNSFDNQEAK